VHRIVCEAWHGPPPTPDHRVNHIDGDKTNNHPENLEWVTYEENRLHAYRTGLLDSCVTEREINAIRVLRDAGETCRTLARVVLGSDDNGKISRIHRGVFYDYVPRFEVFARWCSWHDGPISDLDRLLDEHGAKRSHVLCGDCESKHFPDGPEPPEAA